MTDGKVAQGIDCGFTNDDIEIVILGAAAPQAFLSTRRKAREIPVLDLVTADAVPVYVGEHGIAAHIDAEAAGEAEMNQLVSTLRCMRLVRRPRSCAPVAWLS